MSRNTEKVLFMLVNTCNGVIIIVLNSVAIYKTFKSTKQKKKIDKVGKSSNVSLKAKEIFILAYCEIHESDLKENEKIRKEVKKSYKEAKPKNSTQKKNISKCMVLLLNLAIRDLVTGTGFIFGNLMSLIKIYPHSKTLVFILRFLISCLMHPAAVFSVANLQMVANLKFYAVTRPLKYRSIKQGFLIKICTMKWVLITFSVTLDYTFSYDSYTGHSILFQIITPSLIFLAAIVLAITHFVIFKSIRKRMAVGKVIIFTKINKRNRLLKLVL